jgi:chaperone modulatory protein CbpM
MITLNKVIARTGLKREDLERWIVENWIKPDRDGGDYVFEEVDVARVELIYELHHQLDIDEAAIPVVLSLLDQIYDLRRRMRELGEALSEVAPNEVQRAVADHLAQRGRRVRRL